MAPLVEAAGGEAYSESGKILSAVPTNLHQRTPVIIGVEKLVTECFRAILQQDIQINLFE